MIASGPEGPERRNAGRRWIVCNVTQVLAQRRGPLRRILLLSLLVVGAAVALAIGSYSALAGPGPVTSVASAVIGADEPDDVDVLDAVETDDVDGDDVGGDEVDADDGGGGEAKGAQHIAQVIADEFGASQGDVLALHEQGIGFGALFKLYALAAVMEDTTVQDLLATIPTNGDGEYEFGFGELRKSLTEDQLADLESGPKNLGQIVSASHGPEDAGSPEGAGSDVADDAASAGLEKAGDKFVAHESEGHGPPESVPAHGRR
jgi:hypothetical protein